MARKMPGTRTDALREPPGKISSRSIEPLSNKMPFKEMVPESLTKKDPKENHLKISKITQSLPLI